MAVFCQAQQSVVQWQADPPAQGAQQGVFRVRLRATIAPGWHMYAPTQKPGGPTAMSLTLPADQPFRLAGALELSTPPHKAHDDNFEMDTESYEGAAEFAVPVQATSALAAGPAKLTLAVRFQVCNASSCLPPQTVPVATTVKILRAASTPMAPTAQKPAPTVAASVASAPSASSAPATAPVTAPKEEPNEAQQAAAQGLGAFVWLAMGMGALSLLTPCVFPMIPITVSFFTHQQEQKQGSALGQALLYALGIIATFTALGLALAFVFGAAGVNQLAANPWVNLLITAVFVGFALSLWGVYFVQVPSRILSRLDGVARREGAGRMVGILLMGFTFSLTSFTCTAPFAGTLLVMASQGDWKWPLVGMLAYSSVFALPFFLLALAPGALARLPKAGGWMNAVKVLMGLLELAAAMKFLSNADLVWRWGLFTRGVVLAVWTAIALLMTLYLLGKFRMSEDAPVESLTAPRLLLALGTLTLAIWLAGGLEGRPLGELESFLPPAEAASGQTSSAAALGWMENDYAGALAAAQAQGKPVLIDFTGYTCTNCRWMEANMFPRAAVARQLAGFVRLRLYTDGDGPLYAQQQQMEKQRFGTIALPYYVLLAPDGHLLASFPGLTRDEGAFLGFLAKGHTGQ